MEYLVKIMKTKNLMFLLFIFISVPIYFYTVSSGLDNSGMYGLNIYNSLNIKFGKDVIYTFGPLGFVLFTMNFGSNIVFNILIWSSIYCFQLWILTQIFYFDKSLNVNKKNIILSFIFYILPSFISPEYYYVYVILLALAYTWFGEKKEKTFFICCMYTSLMLFIKFSSAILLLSSIFLFIFVQYFINVKLAKKLTMIFAVIPLTFVIGYLLYCPSLTALYTYVKSAFEISSGYNDAMSIYCDKRIVYAAILIALFYFLFLAITIIKNKNLGLYMITLSGAFFLAFKHGFVRADGHIELFFKEIFILLSIIVLFYTYDQKFTFVFKKVIIRETFLNKSACICIIIMTIISGYALNTSVKSTVNNFENKYNTIVNTKSSINNPIIGESILPQEILDKIKDSTVTIYPWELSYAAHYSLNFRPMPITQIYSAYNRYLDKLNAEFFNYYTAPQYIILQLNTIDGRLPFMEAPNSWNMILQNYHVDLIKDGVYLMKKNDSLNNVDYKLVKELTVNKNDMIEIPSTNKIVSVKITSNLNFKGKMYKFLYRIPEVRMKLYNTNGEVIREGRVLLDNLNYDNGVVVNNVPSTDNEMIELVNYGTGNDKISCIKLEGPGLIYYDDNLKIEVFERNQEYYADYLPQNLVSHIEDFSNISDNIKLSDTEAQICIDKITKNSEEGTINLNSKSYLEINGWAIDSINQEYAPIVYIKIGDKLFNTIALNRKDVTDYFKINVIGEAMYGFDSYISCEDVKKGTYNIELVVVSYDRLHYSSIKTQYTVNVN